MTASWHSGRSNAIVPITRNEPSGETAPDVGSAPPGQLGQVKKLLLLSGVRVGAAGFVMSKIAYPERT